MDKDTVTVGFRIPLKDLEYGNIPGIKSLKME